MKQYTTSIIKSSLTVLPRPKQFSVIESPNRVAENMLLVTAINKMAKKIKKFITFKRQNIDDHNQILTGNRCIFLSFWSASQHISNFCNYYCVLCAMYQLLYPPRIDHKIYYGFCYIQYDFSLFYFSQSLLVHLHPGFVQNTLYVFIYCFLYSLLLVNRDLFQRFRILFCIVIINTFLF